MMMMMMMMWMMMWMMMMWMMMHVTQCRRLNVNLYTYDEVVCGDTAFLVLLLQVSNLSAQSLPVIKKTNGHIKTAKNSVSVSLELSRVDVGTVDTGEESASLRVVVEQPT
jgi:hypothetical protein